MSISKSIETRIAQTKVIAVVILDQLADAKPLAEALLKGGVDAIELTLRTPIALEAGSLIKKDFPNMLLGFGTVLTTEQVEGVSQVGADFAVAPGCNPKIIEKCQSLGLSFAPGIMTPTDIEMALQSGCKVLKYFPAETSGGLPHLNSMAAPYKHLGLQFIPLGGVNQSNAISYLSSPLITAVGGSWVAKRTLIQEGRWVEIEENARLIKSAIREHLK
ncbi:MAG: bifunctional 4-hydroxy-2-oxoglutarate aldolase/2-dehydro-3-deoxy-phosphogluconate aldolase [Saprospiraceae bacterium]|nr:bifunctional 4-hydroxy-2-oxoglutarate aldolase/2-dehydro-3-deoxy-phosphogluconate aldolase [Saprospiraceae bacterium]